MKKISLFLFFTSFISHAYPQEINSALPPEFKNVAIEAFQKVSPSAKRWFENAAKQHPAGIFDTAWAKRKLKEKFTEKDVNRSGELFMVMMEYQRMLNKEEREDRKIGSKYKQLVLTEKEKKIKMDNDKIDQQKKEAEQKEGNAMNAAQVSLWTGIVSGASTVMNSNPGQSDQNKKRIKLYPVVIKKIDSPKLKIKTAGNNEQVQKAEQQAKDDDAAKKGSEDHKKAIEDAIKKLLDQMNEMNPKL